MLLLGQEINICYFLSTKETIHLLDKAGYHKNVAAILWPTATGNPALDEEDHYLSVKLCGKLYRESPEGSISSRTEGVMRYSVLIWLRELRQITTRCIKLGPQLLCHGVHKLNHTSWLFVQNLRHFITIVG